MSRRNTTYVKLTQDDWKDIKDIASTLTGYDPENSGIKGKTTVELMNQTTAELADALTELSAGETTAATNLVTDVHRTLMQLMRREAYNRVIGEQKREKIEQVQKQQAASA